jgi:hypothetical protein
MVSDDTELMLDYRRAEESMFHRIILRNLRGKVEDVFFRLLQLFIVQAYPRLSIAQGRREVI